MSSLPPNNNQLPGAQGSSSSQPAEASGGPNTPAANNNDQTGAALGPAAQDAALANSAQHNNNQQQQQGADHDDMPPLPFPLPPEADVVMMDAGPAPMQGPQQGGAGVAADLDINGPLLIDAIAAAEAEAPDGAAAAAPALPAAGAGPVDMEADDDAAAAWEWNQDVAQLVGGLLQLVNGPDCPLTARVLLAVLLDFILHWLGMGGVLDILEDGLIAAAQHAYAEACTQGGTVPSFLQFPGLQHDAYGQGVLIPGDLPLLWENQDEANQADNAVANALFCEGYTEGPLELLPVGQLPSNFGYFAGQEFGQGFE